MIKYINLIAYIPGLAGRFTQFLTSLHPTTVPDMSDDTSITDVSVNRARRYSYKDLYARHGSWVNHHNQFRRGVLTDYDLSRFLESNYSNYNFCIHPTVFYLQKFVVALKAETTCQILKNKIQKENLQIRYLQMVLSEEYQPMINQFKFKNGNFPRVASEEKILNLKFTKEYSPYLINLDNYFIGESNFLDEYTKLMDYLEIPAQVDLALQLYQGWIEARNSNP